ncbi:MAG: carbonic anhydrase, partial [Cytophagales bacterium]|nr:carbonic anhydrase [Cytophagales bacterium]
NKWLRNIKEVYYKHRDELSQYDDLVERGNRLVELNVIEQVHNLAKTSFVQKALKENEIKVHAWVYDIYTGLIKDLNAAVDELSDLDEIFRYE